MILAVDVQYADKFAAVAGVTFESWPSPCAASEQVRWIANLAPYLPGEFWRRELPCIQALLLALGEKPSVVVIDGYVWLDGNGRPGLGAHLYAALQGKIPVIGVAKTAFLGSPHAQRVQRGASRRPLYVTAQGMPAIDAAETIRQMHGAHRIPTLLKRVDRLCRDALEKST